MVRFQAYRASALLWASTALLETSVASAFVPPPTHSRSVLFETSQKRTCFTSSSLQSSLLPIVDPLLVEHIATGGVLTLVGDIVAQSLTSTLDDDKSIIQIPPRDWDKVRTAAFVTFGALYTGGVQHYIFGFLNAEFSNPLQRLALAQFFFIPFCYYPTFLLMVPTLRAWWDTMAWDDEAIVLRQQLTSDVLERLPSTLLRNWCFWLPVQFVQFTFIPADLQVTYCAAFGVVWNAILSWSTNASAAAATTSTVEGTKSK